MLGKKEESTPELCSLISTCTLWHVQIVSVNFFIVVNRNHEPGSFIK